MTVFFQSERSNQCKEKRLLRLGSLSEYLHLVLQFRLIFFDNLKRSIIKLHLKDIDGLVFAI